MTVVAAIGFLGKCIQEFSWAGLRFCFARPEVLSQGLLMEMTVKSLLTKRVGRIGTLTGCSVVASLASVVVKV